MAQKPLIDRILLASIARGSQSAFRKVFDQYYDRLYGVAFAMTKSPATAEDLIQEIFLKIWENRAGLTEIGNFNSYLYTVARNHILNSLRNKVKEEGYTEYLAGYFRDSGDSPLQQVIAKETRDLMEKAVGQLPSQQQRVYRLAREEGLSQDEIAKEMKITVSTVKSHMNKALAFIRHYLLKHSHCILLFLIWQMPQK